MREKRPWGDAVVTGYGTVFGRPDLRLLAGFHRLRRLAERGVRREDLQGDGHGRQGRLPGRRDQRLGRRADPGGRRLARRATPRSSGGTCRRRAWCRRSRSILGPCAGGAVYSPAITDFVLMAEGTSYMFITGPDVVKTVTGEEVTQEELGGASAHASRSGVAHLVGADEEAVIDDARYLLSFLPQNNLEPRAVRGPGRPGRSRVARARHARSPTRRTSRTTSSA